MDPGSEVLRRLLAPFASLAEVFRNPDMARLQLAGAGYSFSLWGFAITLGVYAFGVGGAAAVGIAGLARLLPGLLASPLGGLLGDRHSRRLVLAIGTGASGLVLAGSAVAVASGSPAWIVYVLAGLTTVCNAPFVPAEAALMPKLARTPQELSAANVIHNAMHNLGFLGGSLIGGLLLAFTSIAVVFAVTAAVALASGILLLTLRPDRRPAYIEEDDANGVFRQIAAGFRTLASDAPLRLLGVALSLLLFFEGAFDVLIVVVALDLLGLTDSSVGYLNAAWGIGGVLAGGGLAVLINRGRLVSGLVIGSALTGVAMALPGLWALAAVTFVACFGIGVGYTFVEVAAETLFQRLGDDEEIARVRGALESARLAATSIGTIAMAGLISFAGVRVGIFALAAALPLFVVLRWRRLRSYEMGAPVEAHHFELLRDDPIFTPLPLATLERITQDLVPLEFAGGDEVITQGEAGDRFYLIDTGRVEVLEDGAHRRFEGPGESFGEIALLRDTPRTATVRTTEPTRFLTLERERFITAVTGHRRTNQVADTVIDTRLTGPPA